MGLNRQAAPRARPALAARRALPARAGPARARGRFRSRRPRPRRRRDQVLDRPRGHACRTDPASGRGLRSDRPARRHHPEPSPGSRCGRGTRFAAERQFSRPRGLPQPGWAPPGRPCHPRESHCGAAGHDRAPGRAQSPHHSGRAGDRGRRKSHPARQAPHGAARPGGPVRRQVLAAHNPAAGHRAWARSPGPHRLARGLPLPARAPGHDPDRPARGPARGPDPHRGHDPDPARDHAVCAGGPPGNYACSRRGSCPVPDQGLPRPARRAGRNRRPRPGRRAVRNRGSRGPVNWPARNRPPSRPGSWTGEVTTPPVRPPGHHRGPPPRPAARARNPWVPPGHNRMMSPPAGCGDHNQPRAHPNARRVRGRTPRLPRDSPGCPAGPGSPGRPANPPGPPGCAGPAPSRGTAAVDTHAGAGHRGTRVRDRRSHAPAARAAVPVGSRRSFVPLPCQ